METKGSTVSAGIKGGIIIALALIIFALILYLLDLGQQRWISSLGFLIIIIGLIFTIKGHRDRNLSGAITFGQAFSTGAIATLIFTVGYAIYTYLFFTVIDPDFVNYILEQTQKEMIESGQSDENIEMAMEYTRRFTSPFWMTTWVVGSYIVFGVIISLIASAFLQKNEPVVHNDSNNSGLH